MVTCNVRDCAGRPQQRGMCAKHYSRWRRHGDPTVGSHHLRLDSRPLLEALAARRCPINELLPDRTDQTAVHRARRQGTVDEFVADRIAVRALRLTVDEVYGFILEEATA
jgi:hypothetical protein